MGRKARSKKKNIIDYHIADCRQAPSLSSSLIGVGIIACHCNYCAASATIGMLARWRAVHCQIFFRGGVAAAAAAAINGRHAITALPGARLCRLISLLHASVIISQHTVARLILHLQGAQRQHPTITLTSMPEARQAAQRR